MNRTYEYKLFFEEDYLEREKELSEEVFFLKIIVLRLGQKRNNCQRKVSSRQKEMESK